MIPAKEHQIAMSIFAQVFDTISRQASLGGVCNKAALMQPRQSDVFRGCPQIALPVFSKADKSIGDDARRIALIEDGEAHSVKADQSIVSGQPDIAIARLHDVADRVLRQSVIGRPVIEMKLSVRRLTAKQEKEAEKKPRK
ncbi:MAG TPA: hypothetical protein VJX67_14525 [Blastocatellia bacterium]|nr:hypothetical protein [Blastocatellia bacterium]